MNVLDLSIVSFPSPFEISEPNDPASAAMAAISSWMEPKSTLTPPDEMAAQAIEALSRSPISERNALLTCLIDQYMEDIRIHFTKTLAPLLQAALSGLEYKQHTSSLHPRLPTISEDSSAIKLKSYEVLPCLISLLKTARFQYLYPLSYFPDFPPTLEVAVDNTFSSFAALALPFPQLLKAVKNYLSSIVLASAKEESMDLINTLQDIYRESVGSTVEQGTGALLQNELLRSYILDVATILRQEYGGVWDRTVIKDIDEWTENVLAPIAIELFPENSTGGIWGQDKNGDNLKINANLKRLTKDILLEIRTHELFDIVVNYPESLPAINDMRAFLHTSAQRASIVISMQQSCSRRLLHGGANTVDVLAMYVSLIRVFAILEPRGILLHKIARPIRRYLKERKDTIREVLSGLLGDKRSPIKDLASELIDVVNISEPYIPAAGIQEREDLEDAKNMSSTYKTLLKDPDMSWAPDPMDAPPNFQIDNKTFDVISNLVSVFDNKDILAKELMKRFADTVIFSQDFNEETMLMTIELLKIKVGEDPLANLDVMIKDMSESKRIDNLVHVSSSSLPLGGDVDMEDAALKDKKKVDEMFHTNVISKLFWPKYNYSSCRAPKEIEEQMSSYSLYFQQLKQGRSLNWMGNIGRVTVEIEQDDTSADNKKNIVEYVVSPEKASVVYLFQEKEEWAISDVCTQLEMKEPNARSALQFWCNRGVLYFKAAAEVYCVQKEQNETKQSVYNLEATSSAREESNEEMRVYWSYIVGMLTNLGAIPVPKIHSFLKMLVPANTPYTKSMEELKTFLDAMVEEKKLVVVDEAYKLVK